MLDKRTTACCGLHSRLKGSSAGYVNPTDLILRALHCKKRLAILPSPAGMSHTKLSLAGNYLVFPPRESLVSDIPAGDGKTADLFYSVLTAKLFCTWRFKSYRTREEKQCAMRNLKQKLNYSKFIIILLVF